MEVRIKLKGSNVYFDVYNDEVINYTRKSSDFERLDLMYNDFSRGFTLPATINNNKLFKHYYDINIVESFNPFIENKCDIYLNGELFSSGSLRLLSVVMKDNVPDYYKVQFYSDEIGINDILEDKLISDIKLYTDVFPDWVFPISVEIIEGIINGTYSGIPVDGDMYYNINSIEDKLLLDYVYGDPGEGYRVIGSDADTFIQRRGLVYTDMRPFLDLKTIFNSLKQSNVITGESIIDIDMSDIPEMDDLFMYVDNGKKLEDSLLGFEYNLGKAKQLKNDFEVVKFDSKILDENNMYSSLYGYGTIPLNGTYNVEIKLITDNPQNIQYELTAGTTTITATDVPSSGIISLTFSRTTGNDSVLLKLRNKQIPSSSSYYSNVLQIDSKIKLNDNSNTITDIWFDVQKFLPEIKIVDLIKSLSKMFNATLLKTGENSYKFVTRSSFYYENVEEIDITDYIDTNTTMIDPPTYYKRYSMKFKDGEDYINTTYTKNNGRPYGSVNYDTGTLYGDEYKIETSNTNCLVSSIETYSPSYPVSHYYSQASFLYRYANYLLELDNKLFHDKNEFEVISGLTWSNPPITYIGTGVGTQSCVYIPNSFDTDLEISVDFDVPITGTSGGVVNVFVGWRSNTNTLIWNTITGSDYYFYLFGSLFGSTSSVFIPFEYGSSSGTPVNGWKFKVNKDDLNTPPVNGVSPVCIVINDEAYDLISSGANWAVNHDDVNIVINNLTSDIKSTMSTFQVVNDEGKSVKGGLRLLYDNGYKTADKSYLITSRDNLTYSNPVLRYRDLNNYSDTHDINLSFNSEYSYVYQSTDVKENTLFSKFYSNYISKLYNPRTRSYTFDVYMTYQVIKDIKLNTTIVVNNNKFLIDNLTFNLNDGKGRIKLINKL